MEEWIRKLRPIAVLALVAAAASGCASRIVRHDPGVACGTQGGASELVFSGPMVTASPLTLPAQAAPEYRRLEASLNVRPALTAYEACAWPEAPAPSLDRVRRIFLDTSPREYIYFNSTRGRYDRTYVYP